MTASLAWRSASRSALRAGAGLAPLMPQLPKFPPAAVVPLPGLFEFELEVLAAVAKVLRVGFGVLPCACDSVSSRRTRAMYRASAAAARVSAESRAA